VATGDEPGPAPDAAGAEAGPKEAVVLQSIGRRLLAQGGGMGVVPRLRPVAVWRDDLRRRRLITLAAILVAAVLGVAGGIWVADSPTNGYESGAAAAADQRSVESPMAEPGGTESPRGPADDPNTAPAPAGGEPPDAPGDSEPIDPASQGSPSPRAAAPEPAAEPDPPAPATPEQPEPNVAEEEVVETPGGTLLARCVNGSASVEPLDLAPGYAVVREENEPADKARIVLRSAEDDTRVRVRVRCRDGIPTGKVKVN
jgi:eukaryotic-like serine/threonine-protein kinase